MKFTCHTCQKVFGQKPSSDVRRGRKRRLPFCSVPCYDAWKKAEHLRMKAEWLRFQRTVWGSTDIVRRNPAGARAAGRVAEEAALRTILPVEGFGEVEDFSGYSNQFFIDFIASRDGRRVLVDATVRLKAYVPEKARLASALRMPLWILHVSPITPGLYHLALLPPGRVATRVPASLIRRLLASSSGG